MMPQPIKDEIAAKKAKLAEMRRQRDQREQKAKDFASNRQSIGTPTDYSPSQNRPETRKELDSLISSLVGEDRGSPARGSPRRVPSYATPTKGDRATSELPALSPVPPIGSSQPQTLSFAPLTVLYEIKSDPLPQRREVISYSKGVQTSAVQTEETASGSDTDSERAPLGERRPSRKLSRRQRERDEEIRQSLRKEIEAELKATAGIKEESAEDAFQAKQENFPVRNLTNEEIDAVASSPSFLEFVDRSTKVIERALDEQYDVLADYQYAGTNGVDDDDAELGTKARKGRRIKEAVQFYDERWSKKRMISDISFSQKFPELVLASYTKNPSAPYEPDGLIQVWNLHMHDRPEYVFQGTSDILTAKFSPFHPNLIVGGSYSGQVLLWDTRSHSPYPVQRTPLTGNGHTHPVYNINIVGTQNAHNIISTSTDGVLCSWTVDMLSRPQEYLELTSPPLLPSSNPLPTLPHHRPTDDLAPTATAFPPSDPTYLLAGTESGTIHLAHRYDRAGARAGIDARVAYRAHTAPVMSLDFHPATGHLDLGDLVLSASIDWSVKLWRVRTPSASVTRGPGAAQVDLGVDNVAPVLDLTRDDAVYDAKWSPVRPGVFACVDGVGALEVWDLTVDMEVPAARGAPAARVVDGLERKSRSLNKCAWETHEGRRIGVGGLDGVLSVWEVGSELGGDNAKQEEYTKMKKLVQRMEGAA